MSSTEEDWEVNKTSSKTTVNSMIISGDKTFRRLLVLQ